jgi:hypothetical protein
MGGCALHEILPQQGLSARKHDQRHSGALEFSKQLVYPADWQLRR